MLNKKGLCIQCNEAISNPVCEQCWFKQITSWIRETSINKRDRGMIIKEIKKTFRFFDSMDSDTKCIICKNEFSVKCGYCFFLDAYRILKKHKIHVEDMEPFLEMFNYSSFNGNYAGTELDYSFLINFHTTGWKQPCYQQTY